MKAILLAAGLGSRLRPLTDNCAKALIQINGQNLIERQIEFLHQRCIEEIYVLTGYLANQFHYLQKKYGVQCIYNPCYNQYNNLYSMYLVREHLSDCYVIDADVYLHNNFLITRPVHSLYFSGFKSEFSGEWVLHTSQDRRVTQITVEDGCGYIMSGVSYWSQRDAQVLLPKLEAAVAELQNNSNERKNCYWDHIVKENLSYLEVYRQDIESGDCFEIDTIADLLKVRSYVEAK